MSIKLLERGWRCSKAKGGDLLVLLGIADFANDDGVAYPSIPTLARKARLTPRNTQRAIRHLVASGELCLEEGKGPHRTHLYRIILSEEATVEGCQNARVTKSQGDIYDKGRVTFQPPNPLKRTVIKKEICDGDKKSPSRPVDHEFEEFWNLYPMRNGKRVEKPGAVKKFQALKPDDRVLVLTAVRNYARSELVEKGIGIKDAHRWLRTGKDHEPWRDWMEPEQPHKTRPNGHGPAQTCTKRVQAPGDKFLRACGQPASPESRPTEPRCSQHLSEATRPKELSHAAH